MASLVFKLPGFGSDSEVTGTAKVGYRPDYGNRDRPSQSLPDPAAVSPSYCRVKACLPVPLCCLGHTWPRRCGTGFQVPSRIRVFGSTRRKVRHPNAGAQARHSGGEHDGLLPRARR